jgi:hypothetical protein
MTITVDCFLLLFDIIEHIKGTEFSPKLVVSNQVTWPISQEKNSCGSYSALTGINFTVQQ